MTIQAQPATVSVDPLEVTVTTAVEREGATEVTVSAEGEGLPGPARVREILDTIGVYFIPPLSAKGAWYAEVADTGERFPLVMATKIEEAALEAALILVDRYQHLDAEEE